VNGNRIAEDLGYLDTFKQQARAFSNHILHDVPPLSGLEDVLNVLRITDAAYESAEKETVVALR
jgi:predicted dehydrogenase